MDPLNSSCFQKLQFPERKLKLQVLRKSNSLEKEVVLKGTLPANKLRNNYVIFRHFLVTNKRNKKLTILQRNFHT